MRLILNGETKDFETVATLAELLARLELSSDTPGVALALNDSVVPRIDWNHTKLANGDRVEIIHAVQGG